MKFYGKFPIFRLRIAGRLQQLNCTNLDARASNHFNSSRHFIWKFCFAVTDVNSVSFSQRLFSIPSVQLIFVSTNPTCHDGCQSNLMMTFIIMAFLKKKNVNKMKFWLVYNQNFLDFSFLKMSELCAIFRCEWYRLICSDILKSTIRAHFGHAL